VKKALLVRLLTLSNVKRKRGGNFVPGDSAVETAATGGGAFALRVLTGSHAYYRLFGWGSSRKKLRGPAPGRGACFLRPPPPNPPRQIPGQGPSPPARTVADQHRVRSLRVLNPCAKMRRQDSTGQFQRRCSITQIWTRLTPFFDWHLHLFVRRCYDPRRRAWRW